MEWVRAALESSDLMKSVWGWLQGVGAGNLKTVVAPLIVIFAVTPVIVLLSLLLVAAFMTPALATLVAERRFPQLERKHGGSLAASIAWSLGSTLLALVALVVSLPLWLVPPLILILPPLIWGWLTYRVMAFDALSEHASGEERREVFRAPPRAGCWASACSPATWARRPACCGLRARCSRPPSSSWCRVAIWIYTLVFAFASLWFAHYCLAALEQLRAEPAVAARRPLPPPPQLRAGPVSIGG